MAKIKYDVTGVEAGGDFETPKQGIYVMEITQCDAAKPEGKDKRLELIYKITDGEFKGSQVWDYINLESEAAHWKYRQFLEAVGLVTGRKEKGTLDTDAVVGKKIRVRVVHDTYNGDVRAKAGRLLPLKKDDDEGDAEAEGATADQLDPEEEEEDAVDLDAMDRAELKKFIKDEDLGIRVMKGWSDDDIRDKIAEKAGEEPEGEEEPEEEAEEEGEAKASDDYDEWSEDELKEELGGRELSKRGSKPTLIKRLREDDGSKSDDPF